jgi:hypothetical protein
VATLDHLGITIDDLARSVAQFDPVMTALGYTREDADGSVSWYQGEQEIILGIRLEFLHNPPRPQTDT